MQFAEARNLETLQAQSFKVSGLFLAFASSRFQGFWPFLGLSKLKVSRFLAFSWLLQAQGFKVSGLFLALQAQGFKVSGLFLALQAQSFKVSGLYGFSFTVVEQFA